MAELVALGLAADWLNAWLAAVGVTVLVPDVRLSWTDDPVPRARFTAPDGCDVAAAIAEALPSADDVRSMAFDGPKQWMSHDDYRRCADRARILHDDSLAVLATDLAEPAEKGLATGELNVGVPKGITLSSRVASCADAASTGGGDKRARVAATLEGRGERVVNNGLGFDYRRLAGPILGETKNLVDPVVELLCFHGTLLFPTRGDGRRVRQRGWTVARTRHRFVWPTWSGPLDRWGVDALLDLTYEAVTPNGSLRENGTDGLRRLAAWGVTGLYGLVPFAKYGSATTSGYAAERIA